MSLKDQQIEQEVVPVQRAKLINHPAYLRPVLLVQNGWKNTYTKEVVWDKAKVRGEK